MNKFLSTSLLLMLLVTAATLFLTQSKPPAEPTETVSGKAEIGGTFTLTDANGTTVSDAQFRGKNMLVFFGFTHCPDVCPLTLATYTQALELMGSDVENIAPIFISVDPKRDTAERLKEYLSNFDSRIIALTGTPEQIKDVAKLYKAFYSEVPNEEKKEDVDHSKMDHSKMQHHGDTHAEDNYMVDHSSFIYLMDVNGEYVTHFPHTIAPDELAKQVSESIKK